MGRWRQVDNPLVKAVAGFTVPLFLALNFPAVFLALVTGLMFYALALVGVAHAYRRSHRVVGEERRCWPGSRRAPWLPSRTGAKGPLPVA